MNALAVALLLVFLRVAAFVVFLPPFSGRSLPHSVKVGLAVCLTAVWGSKVVPLVALEIDPVLSGSWVLVGWLAIRETLFGASLGWLLGMILMPIRIAGAYIVQEMGLTMGAIASPGEGMDGSVLSQLFEVAAVLYLFGTNLHHDFLRLFDITFELFPPAQTWSLPSQTWVIGTIAHTTNQGLAIAAPVGIVLFAGLVTTLIVMRQAPNFNLFSFGMPFRLILGMGAVLWFLPSVVAGMVGSLRLFMNFNGL